MTLPSALPRSMIFNAAKRNAAKYPWDRNQPVTDGASDINPTCQCKLDISACFLDLHSPHLSQTGI